MTEAVIGDDGNADVSAAGEPAGHAPRRRLQAGRAESVGGLVTADGLRQGRFVAASREVGAVLRRVVTPERDVG